MAALPLHTTDLLAHYRRIAQQPLTVVDVETTGFRPPGARVIELSVLHASLADGIYEQSTHLFNPGVSVPAEITRFTGITQAMVDNASPAEQLWPRYHRRLDDGVLTAHNLSFDYGFLRAELQRHGLAWERPESAQFCTVKLSRLMLADLPSRSLPRLVETFDFKVGASHRAEADTLACWLLAQRLLTELMEASDQGALGLLRQEWIPLSKAAQIVGRSRQKTQNLLHELCHRQGWQPRRSQRSQAYRYRRHWADLLREQVAQDP